MKVNRLETFHYLRDGVTEPGIGLISNPLPPFPQSWTTHFLCLSNRYVKPTAKNGYALAHSVNQILLQITLANIMLLLTIKGILRMHAGEVPYWTSQHQECLQQEGCVYCAELELQPNEVDKERDPFCGIH